MTNRDQDFSEFMAARWPALHRFAYLLCGESQAAEDLAQAALARAYVAWGRLQARNAAEAYVRKIMLRLYLNERRRRRPRTVPLTDQTGGATSPADVVEDRSLLWAAVSTLPARQRAVIVLRYYEDQSEASIAELLGCSRGTVKSTSSKALVSLRGALPAEVGHGNGRQP